MFACILKETNPCALCSVSVYIKLRLSLFEFDFLSQEKFNDVVIFLIILWCSTCITHIGLEQLNFMVDSFIHAVRKLM